MVLPFDTVTKSAAETQKLGEEIGRANVSNVICLWGELGSGKTTFVQGFARGLSVTSRLLSPTFIIVRRYQMPRDSRFLYHLDLYRIKEPKDALAVGFEEMVADMDSVVVIEWPERLGTLLPEKRLDIHFGVLPNGDHEIKATSTGN